MTPGLINFPDPSVGDWKDDGGDGLFVLIVIPEPEDPEPDNCAVDVSIYGAVRMTVADAHAGGPYVWPEWDHRQAMRAWDARKKVVDRAWSEDDVDTAHWAARALSPHELSDPMLAAVHAGSMGWVPVHADGRAWIPSYDDLTDAGKAVWDSLKAAFETEPVLIACLDT